MDTNACTLVTSALADALDSLNRVGPILLPLTPRVVEEMEALAARLRSMNHGGTSPCLAENVGSGDGPFATSLRAK